MPELHWRHVLVWVGLTAAVIGPAITVIAMAQHWRPGITAIGIGVAIIGLLLIMFGYMLRIVGTIGEIYHTGYNDGLTRGRREGRRIARPVVVAMRGAGDEHEHQRNGAVSAP